MDRRIAVHGAERLVALKPISQEFSIQITERTHARTYSYEGLLQPTSNGYPTLCAVLQRAGSSSQKTAG